MIHSHEERLRAYELLAEAFGRQGLQGPQGRQGQQF